MITNNKHVIATFVLVITSFETFTADAELFSGQKNNTHKLAVTI